MDRKEWDPLTWPKLLGFGACCAIVLLLMLCSEKGFVFLLDHANLLFHEAGHVFVALLSERLEPYGGTIGQLVFPCIIIVTCWRKGQSLGVAAGGIWLFENCFNIARYMNDARQLKLPLVGGGDHDWNTIFSRWDILQFDDRIATCVSWAGWLGIGAALAWLGWRAWSDRIKEVL
jgi:hypothetical protein